MEKAPIAIIQQFMLKLGVSNGEKNTWLIGDRWVETDPKNLDELRRSFLRYDHRHEVAPPIFQLKGAYKESFLNDSEKPDLSEGEYDFIFAQTPLNYRGSHRWLPDLDPSSQLTTDLALITLLSQQLSISGLGFFTVTARAIWGQTASAFEEELKANHLSIVSFIELPKDIYEPLTPVNVYLAVISRINVPLVAFSLRDSKPETVAADLKRHISGELPLEVVEEFKGFDSRRAQSQLKRLTSIYNTYSTKRLEELVSEVAKGKKGNRFPSWDNCIHLQIGSGNIRATADTKSVKDTPSNILLKIDSEIEAEYVALYLNSPRGKLAMDATQPDRANVRISNLKSVLEEVLIPIPPKADRLAMLDARNSLIRLSSQIEQIQDEIVLNPLSAGLNEKVQQMLAIAAAQTEGDRLKSLILRGESKVLEFKQTFQRCIKSKQKEQHIETSALKTLVGFLNTDGGTLLIGVEDSGEILGVKIEREKHHKNSNDKFMLHITDKVKSRIGIEALQDIDIKVTEVGSAEVIRIDCKKASDSVFLDGKDFYIRNPPSTEKLEGKDLANYLKKRFPSS